MKLFFHQIWFWLTTWRQCAWCKTILHVAPFARHSPENTTHGICAHCAAAIDRDTQIFNVPKP